MNTLNNISIGIVGGGKGGSEIMTFLSGIPSIELKYIVDRNPAAVAFAFAKESSIPTSTNLERTVPTMLTDFIIEATGSQEVLELIRSSKHENTEIISSKSALLIFRILDENRHKLNTGVKSEIEEIRTGILDEVRDANKFLSDINNLTVAMKVLSINAAVEAARSGSAGAGFAIVAGEMKNMSDKARGMADNIKNITGSIAELSQKIDAAITRLE